MIDKIRLFFKRIFGISKPLLLEEPTDKNSLLDEKLDINKDKDIIMYLYKQVRLKNIEPRFIPDEYLKPIIELLKEETNITENKIQKVKAQIMINERILNQN